MNTPTLIGKRVLLRELQQSDASDIQNLAGHPSVAENRMSIPYPYEDGVAEEWISGLAVRIDRGELATFAVVKLNGHQLVGEVSLRINQESNEATLSYWIGKPYWSMGYCTEAASIVVDFGFEQLHLSRINARCLPNNAASQRVLQKIGMCMEGRTCRYNTKTGQKEDLILFSVHREVRSGAKN